MKSFKLSITALLALSSMVNAGGDLIPVTPYEVKDQVIADYDYEKSYVAPEPVIEYVVPAPEPIIEEVYVAPEPVYVEPEIEEEYIAPEPVIEEEYIAPAPVEREPVYIEPKPQPVVIAPIPMKPTPVLKAKNISPSGFYAGLGINSARYEDSCKCSNGKGSNDFKDTTYGVLARVGYDINQYIGVEARGSKTNWDSHGSKVEHGGVYAKPMLPVGNNANIYGLVGLAKTRVTSNNGKTPKVNSDGLALGIGMEMDLSKDIAKEGRYSRPFDGQGDQEKGLGLFVDYERMLVKKDAPDLDALSAGVTYDF